MSRASVLARGRRAAEARMVDTCTIRRPDPNGNPVLDENTGQYLGPPPITVYSGKCEFQVSAVLAGAQNAEAAGDTVTVQDQLLKLPVEGDSASVRVDDTVTCDTSAHDPDLPGRRFRVDALHHESYATSRRLPISEITGG